MNRVGVALVVATGLLASVLAFGSASAHYLPGKGDRFAYSETITLTNGVGNYTGYTESQTINGSLGITGVLPNGTDEAYYYGVDAYQNNQGQSNVSTASGTFSFSPSTYHYVNGTDDQTGYVDPYVWFYANNSLGVGATFYLLNSEFSVVSTAYDYHLGTSAGNYVTTLYGEGTGSYERDDVYGVFNATYTWQVYFDPGTGFIVGYLYTEQDRDGSGDGFTWTDQLGVTTTTYALTPGSAPASGGSSGGSTSTTTILLVAGIVIVLVVVIVAIAVARSRRRSPLPKHSPTGRMTYAPPPGGAAPPPINLTPGGQPAVQQIVIKETVKVNCAYCGALIDSTVTKCPYCGATRS